MRIAAMSRSYKGIIANGLSRTNHAGSLKLQKRSSSAHSNANTPANMNAAPAFQ